ncbi:DUF418 domain-containing protein [Parasphingopyxis sp.]|uniref:DUF418 domain-containing protein n=1 Tax=Parasphingopyxis sp. TaxID=1920299 RepID=UPI002607BD15|nr:DUF418 domain-containing protein [Parasphingopyxis sp.]
MATTSPIADRYITMDALRGFGVMSILLINIVAFGMPDMAVVSPAVYGGETSGDVAAWLAGFILVDGKLRALFTLLFGASMTLIAERAERDAQSPAAIHYSRMAWLALFGLLHFLFLWWGDILFLYAGAGCIVFLCRRWQAKTLIKWGVIIYAIGGLLLTIGLSSLFVLQAEATSPGASAEALAEYDIVLTDMGIIGDGVAREIAVYLGSYSEILADKIENRWWMPLQNLILAPLETIPLMMIGMGLYKNRFLLGEWDAARYRKIGLWFTAIGLPISAALGAIVYAKGFDIVWALNVTQGWSALPRLLLAIGYTSLLILAIRAFRESRLIDRVAAAGRAAFTNYLGTSIVCTTIFYGYGLALFGELGRPALYLVVLGVWALMLLWSKPWLDRFRFGPLEWLWRTLARREIQPIRK